MTFAAGLACEGYKPFVAIYSSFMQRAYDQVMHDVVLQKLPVRLMLDRAGLVGADSATHAGAFDLAMGCLPDLVIVQAPSDEIEMMNMVATAAAYNEGPTAVRYPRADSSGLDLPPHAAAYWRSAWEPHRQGGHEENRASVPWDSHDRVPEGSGGSGLAGPEHHDCGYTLPSLSIWR